MRWLILVAIAACSSAPKGGAAGDAGSGDGGACGVGATAGAPVLPPVNAKADYQLGGAYPPPAGVMVVSRDRNEAPAAGLYNICYVNGFQIQPDEAAMWTSQHPDLILKDNGTPVIDTAWNEMLIDVSTAVKRDAVAAIEIDNLDSYSRSHALLTPDNNVAAMALFAAHAHASGLAIAQKNSTELVARKAERGTDFAVAEECDRYSECQAYRDGYGDHVIVIEYRRVDFTTGCTAYPGLSIILRDLDLVTPANGAYVYDAC